MSDIEGEADFDEDLEQTEVSIACALNALADIKAYTLTADELRDFKAAQYALRNISRKHAGENVAALYDTEGRR
jgi:hypothetical protein